MKSINMPHLLGGEVPGIPLDPVNGSLRHSALVLLLCFICGVVPSATAQDRPGQPPNILLIISDDHSWTDYGFMGHPHIRTPHLDRLARESRLFPRGYVPASLCSPSLASILTGRYPHQHKVVCNDPPRPEETTRANFYKTASFREGRERLADFIEETPTLPRLLATRGYLSLQTGKWWQNHPSRGGFTHGMSHGDEVRGGRHGDLGLEIGRKGLQPVYDFIQTAQEQKKPFFIWYAPFLPHSPHNPPEHLLKKYEPLAPSIHVARYWAMVEWFDQTCGELLDHLRKNNLEGDTVVAYVADNGWIQSLDNPRFAPRSKQSPHDGGLRTPIMLHWPGRISPAKIEPPVSSIDLMPTLLKIAGVSPPEDLPGIDLLGEGAVQKREAVLARVSRTIAWTWTTPRAVCAGAG